MRRKRVIATLVGGAAALLLVGSAMAHPGFGIIDRVDVLAEALGITTEEVETAKEDGTLKDLLADVSKDDLKTAYETAAGEAIDAASGSGDITSTQAERLKEVVSADNSDLAESDIEELKSVRGVIEVDVIAVYASLLDMTSEEDRGGEGRRHAARPAGRSEPRRPRSGTRRRAGRGDRPGSRGRRDHRGAGGTAARRRREVRPRPQGTRARRRPWALGPARSRLRRLRRRRQEGCDGHRHWRVRVGSHPLGLPSQRGARWAPLLPSPASPPQCAGALEVVRSRPATTRSRAGCQAARRAAARRHR